MPVDMKPVQSSSVARIGYDEAAQTLLVEWKNGKVSEYSGVPAVVGSGLENAPSVGSRIHAEIKGRYPHRYLGEGELPE